MTYFLDFDRTLFDTDAFIAYLNDDRPDTGAAGKPSEETLAAYLEAKARAGELAFQPGELRRFVYPDVLGFLRAKGDAAVILTYGNPALQKLKVENALADVADMSALYTGDIRKGEYMKGRLDAYPSSLLADDKEIELVSMSEHCPQVALYEIRRDGKPGDGRWPVIRSLIELP